MRCKNGQGKMTFLVHMDKKTPAEKIREYFRQPKWREIIKKQREDNGRLRQ